MPNEILTPAVAGATWAVSAVVVSAAARKVSRTADRASDRAPELAPGNAIPLMGVLGAFVFAAQMVAVPLPFLPGVSGHLMGSVLLAILLGPARAILVITAVLSVQCLIFQDGGILALGANILNMGIIPALLGAWIFRLLRGPAPASVSRVYLATFTAALVGVLAGAVALPFPVAVSGVSAVPLSRFLTLIVGVHIPIALLEATITFGAVSYLCRARPELVPGAAGQGRVSTRAVAASILVAALVVGGLVSLWASDLPDGLEHVLQEYGVIAQPDPAASNATVWQAKLALFPNYTRPGAHGWFWPAAAGLAGTLLTLGVVLVLGRTRKTAG